MNVTNILIIGNGFDLHHGLPTRYTDFLTLVRNWSEFYENMPVNRNVYWKGDYPGNECQKIRLSDDFLTADNIKKFLEIDPINYRWGNIERLNKEINSNLWIRYFVDSKYAKENWIDFEREIEKVVLSTKHFYDTLPSLCDKKVEDSFDKETQNIIENFSEGSSGFPTDKNRALLLDDIRPSRIEELKIKVINTMKDHLDSLIDCLKIYFVEFVDKIDFNKITPAISKIENPFVLNFNYTNYINRYNNINKNSVHYIHGSIDDDTFEYNNMVLGINDENVRDNDFVYFFKYFQRIQKRTGDQYKHWSSESDGYGGRLPFNVYIFGHSLDSNDKSILSEFFERKTVNKIIIYYHNQSAYEMQVINLINMFGKDYVVENVSNKKIQFISIQECERINRIPNFN